MALPAQLPDCRSAIVISARSEADCTGPTLETPCRQRNFEASELRPRSYEVIVLANGCRDGTAHIARAVAARCLPAIPLLEDRDFSFALRRGGARIRQSLAVRATTSARRFARVDGGFGAFVADLVTHGNRDESFSVEDPHLTSRKMRIGAIARGWRSGTQLRPAIEALSKVMSARCELWRMPVGCETLVACEPVPVESAIATIHALIDAPKMAYEFEPSAAAEDAA